MDKTSLMPCWTVQTWKGNSGHKLVLALLKAQLHFFYDHPKENGNLETQGCNLTEIKLSTILHIFNMRVTENPFFRILQEIHPQLATRGNEGVSPLLTLPWDWQRKAGAWDADRDNSRGP